MWFQRSERKSQSRAEPENQISNLSRPPKATCMFRKILHHPFCHQFMRGKTLQELQMVCGTGETKQANLNDIFWQIIIDEYLDFQWPCFWHFDHPLQISFMSSSYQRYYHWLGSFHRNDSMSKLCQRQLTYLHKTSIVAVVITDHFQNNCHVAYLKKSTIIFWRFQWWNYCDVRYHTYITDWT